MEKKNPKIYLSSNLEQIKPKLIKRDIKIISSKKENVIPSVFNINKSMRKNSSQKKERKSNSKNNTGKNKIKNREIYSARERRNFIKPKKKPRKFKDIDEIVLLLQKHIRNYLNRIHNDPKLQMIRMLKEKKKNLFENYKIEKNPTLINEFKKEQEEKNKSDENINLKNEDDIDNKLDINNEKSDFLDNDEEEKENPTKNIIKYVVIKSDKLNEDLEGLQDKYDDLSSIDEDIIKNYIEEPKEISNENNSVNKIKKRKKKPINNVKFELVMEKKNKNEEKNEDINSNELNAEIINSIKNNNEITIPNSVNKDIDNNKQIKTEENSDDKNINQDNSINKENIIQHNENLKEKNKNNEEIVKNNEYSKENEHEKYSDFSLHGTAARGSRCAKPERGFPHTATGGKTPGVVALDGWQYHPRGNKKGHRVDEPRRNRGIPLLRGCTGHRTDCARKSGLYVAAVERLFPICHAPGRFARHGNGHRQLPGMEQHGRTVGQAGTGHETPGVDGDKNKRRA